MFISLGEQTRLARLSSLQIGILRENGSKYKDVVCPGVVYASHSCGSTYSSVDGSRLSLLTYKNRIGLTLRYETVSNYIETWQWEDFVEDPSRRSRVFGEGYLCSKTRHILRP